MIEVNITKGGRTEPVEAARFYQEGKLRPCQ